MKKQRESFKSQWGFILACIGSSVGMGNIWMFSTRVSSYGGGSFLIPYFIFVALVGFTGVIGEMSFGRATRSGPVDAFGIVCERKGKRKYGEMLGMIPVLGAMAMAIGYTVVMGWILKYAVGTFTGKTLAPKSVEEFSGAFGSMASAFGNNGWQIAALILCMGILMLGVVSGIVSIIDYKVTAKGMSNHAGTTMMTNRKDALVGMAKLIIAAEERARELNDTLVFTVGKISVSPGQENVIPGQAVANFEMRHMDKAVTDQFYADIQALAKEIPNCEFEFVNTSAKYSTPCDPRLIKLIDEVCTEKGISHIIMPSGAGHDANSMAHEGVPIGMIFVPSVKGISHQGDEYTKPEHIDMGADVLYQAVLKLDENGV